MWPDLRIVRGFVGGGGDVLRGSGFQLTHPARGEFTVTFNTPFAGAPVVTATAHTEVHAAVVACGARIASCASGWRV